MDSRFGKLKSFVLRRIQFVSMRNQIDACIIPNLSTPVIVQKIQFATQLYHYLYVTTDIWGGSTGLCLMVQKKLTEFYVVEPMIFSPFMIAFGYHCPYRKRNNDFCRKKVCPGEVCPRHHLCAERRSDRITSTLLFLPVSLCGIITQYALSYDRRF